jgi:putative protease
MLELLSPAISPEAVIAAVQSGADAIAIRFGGSAAADFTEEDFFKAVRYCRIRACRVYAELDTLLWDDEFQAAASLAIRSSEAVSAMRGAGSGPCGSAPVGCSDMELHAESDWFQTYPRDAGRVGFSRVRSSLGIERRRSPL